MRMKPAIVGVLEEVEEGDVDPEEVSVVTVQVVRALQLILGSKTIVLTDLKFWKGKRWTNKLTDRAGNTKGGSITVSLISCLTGLD